MSRRILVIDDDAAVCVTVERILRQAGNVVSAVESVPAALDLAGRQNFDLLISDLVMPDVDGITAIRLFKDKYPAMPVVAMSGGAKGSTLDTLALAHAAGADQVLKKPFGLQSLLEVVANAFLQTSLKKAAKLNRLLRE